MAHLSSDVPFMNFMTVHDDLSHLQVARQLRFQYTIYTVLCRHKYTLSECQARAGNVVALVMGLASSRDT